MRLPYQPAAVALLLLAMSVAPPWSASAQQRRTITFGLDWLAEAEYGGYYQALATGAYARHHLNVTIRQGGPQVNQAQLLLAGRLDFTIAGNAYIALNFVRENIPFVAVAAIFQQDPSIILAHPHTGHDTFDALRGQPIMIGADTRIGWWNYLREKYGYSDAQIRPYTFNLAPFLADPRALQQGYLGSEPYLIRQQGGFDPVVLKLADTGFAGYANLIVTSRRLVDTDPGLVRDFVAATAEGWRGYLGGDPGPGNALIRQANPDMTEALLAYGRNALITNNIVEDPASHPNSIGAMTDARWKSFFTSMADAKLYPSGMNYTAAYTLNFVPPSK